MSLIQKQDLSYDPKSDIRDHSIVPLFLLKTYSILNSVSPDIICWSHAGDSFIVKDVKRMSEEVIPAHFKHSKFSSFVRQLNFYGFRKVKGKLNGLVKSEENPWEFRHPYFVRDKPQLLAEIKRSSGGAEDLVNQSGGNNMEVQVLKDQVTLLSDRVEELTRTVHMLHTMISSNHTLETSSNSNKAVVASTSSSQYNIDHDVFDEWNCSLDDDLMKGFLEDEDATLGQPLKKRQRSVDEFALVTPMLPSAQAQTHAPVIPFCDSQSTNFITAIANGMEMAAGAQAMQQVTFEQYAALLTIFSEISKSGIIRPNAQGLGSMSV